MRQIAGAWCVRDGRILLLQRSGGISDSAWVPPGGQVDPGEDPLSAAVRETSEETGLVLAAPELLHSWQWGTTPPAHVHHYIGIVEGPMVRISAEHYDFGWLTPADYVSRHLQPGNERFEVWAREMRESARRAQAWIERLAAST